MSDIQLGQPYVLTADGGYGAGLGAVPTNAVVTPTEIVPPGTAGVGYSTDDVVLVSYQDTVTFPGVTVNRTLAIDVTAFDAAFTLQSSLPAPPPPSPPADPTNPNASAPGGS